MTFLEVVLVAVGGVAAVVGILALLVSPDAADPAFSRRVGGLSLLFGVAVFALGMGWL
jgi:hypothetical protein